ncbi:MAG: amidohydrolase family protein [Desulfovibrionaceae bacterium]|nr:amidohydrolase family protein [Desulfovibrionaceae bacterium]
MPDSALALKARTIITMEGEKAARGDMLYEPLKKIDNGLILVENGRIVAIAKATQINLPPKCPVYDLGNFCLIPGVVNCHTHLDLSALAGKTSWHAGFTAWLTSLIPQLPRGQLPQETIKAASEKALDQLVHSGTRFVADIAGSAKGVLKAIISHAKKSGLTLIPCCEWWGFKDLNYSAAHPWPARVAQEIQDNPELAASCNLAGHALYSTDPQVLREVRQFCQDTGKIFSIHLAESEEETAMLTEGTGPLFELYKTQVLPDSWQAPGLKPLAYAAKLKLLGPGLLAIHGTQLDSQEAQVLACSGTPLCLCPRSNHNLGVGLPKVQELIQENVLLCLGTDGLTSNTDLDVCNEAVFLQQTFDIPPEALIRMLTVNGAQALGLTHAGRLTIGQPASVCALPEDLAF